nr:putative late blight resistance protein homolog R1B-16 [Ipomoea batatas]
MACVALSSLMRTIELDLLNPGRSAIVEDEEQVKYLYQSLGFLKEFLDKSKDNVAAKNLEPKIKDSVFQIEDRIEKKLETIYGEKYSDPQRQKAQRRLSSTLKQAIRDTDDLKVEIRRILYSPVQDFPSADPQASCEVIEPDDDLRRGLLLRVLEFSPPITSSSSLNYISLLRYLGICLGDSSLPLGYLLHLLSRSQNLQTLIVSHKPSSINDGLNSCHYLSSEMWASQELSHVECSYLISLDPPNEVKEKLHTLYWLSPRHCTEEVFSRIPNLETLKITAINQNICLRNPQAFPQNLKELTLFYTRLRWKHINIIGNMPSLQVLKLKREAVCGKTWEPSDGGFCRLKFLLIDYCDQFRYWEATPDHYPVLERLVMRNCRLKEIPNSFEDMITLRLIEICNCSSSLFNSAHRIQKAQQDNLGNYELVVRDVTPVATMESMDSCNSGLNTRVSNIQIVLGVGAAAAAWDFCHFLQRGRPGKRKLKENFKVRMCSVLVDGFLGMQKLRVRALGFEDG